VRAALLTVGAAVVFIVGVAFGQALDDVPAPATRTSVRTLAPATVAPPRQTVTVTVTGG